MRPFVIPTIYTAYDMMSPTVLRMQRNLSSLSSAATTVGIGMTAMGAAIIAPLALAAKSAMDFQKQMANISTLVDTSKESMEDMGNKVLEIAERTPVSINDLTESLYQIRSAGVSASDAMNVLQTSAKLSVAGLSSATEATKAVTSAMVDFKRQNLTASQIANSFFLTVKEGKTKMDAINQSFGDNAPLVASAGVTLQEFNAATAAMTNAGMSASEAQNGIRMSVLGLLNPTTEMNKIFRRLAVTTGSELISKFHGLEGALEAVRDTSKQMGIKSPDLFNRTALTAYTVLMGDLNNQFKANIKEQMAGADALTTAYQKQLGTTASQAMIAKNNLQTLAIAVGDLLLPALTQLFKDIRPVIKKLTDFARKHETIAGIVIKTTAAFGLFAIAVGGVSFAVGTVSKALLLFRGVMWGYNFVIGASVSLTGKLYGALLGIPAAAKRAQAALWAMKAPLAEIAGFMAVYFAAYKGILELQELKSKTKKLNPLGFNYDENANSQGNAAIRTANNISESQYQKQQDYYQFKRTQQLQSGFFGGMAAQFAHDVLNIPIVPKANANENVTGEQSTIDSTIANDKAYQDYSNHNVTVTIKNESGRRMEIAGADGPVKVNISDTTTYRR